MCPPIGNGAGRAEEPADNNKRQREEVEKEKSAPEEGVLKRSRPPSFNTVAFDLNQMSTISDIFVFGKFSFLSIADLAVVSKCSRDWYRRVDVMWREKRNGGWRTMRPWLVSLGMPKDSFRGFRDNHVESLRIDGVAATITKKCQICSEHCEDEEDYLGAFGVVAHELCFSSYSKRQPNKVKSTFHAKKMIIREIGAHSWKKNTAGGRVHARLRALPSWSGCSTHDNSYIVHSGYNELVDAALTLESIMSSPDFHEAKHHYQHCIQPIELERLAKKQRKKAVRLAVEHNRSLRCEEQTKDQLAPWLAAQGLRWHRPEHCNGGSTSYHDQYQHPSPSYAQTGVAPHQLAGPHAPSNYGAGSYAVGYQQFQWLLQGGLK